MCSSTYFKNLQGTKVLCDHRTNPLTEINQYCSAHTRTRTLTDNAVELYACTIIASPFCAITAHDFCLDPRCWQVSHGGTSDEKASKDIRLEGFTVTVAGKDLISDASVTFAFGRRYGEGRLLWGGPGPGRRGEAMGSVCLQICLLIQIQGLANSGTSCAMLVMPSMRPSLLLCVSAGLIGRNGTGKTTLLKHLAMHSINGIPRNCQVTHVPCPACF